MTRGVVYPVILSPEEEEDWFIPQYNQIRPQQEQQEDQEVSTSESSDTEESENEELLHGELQAVPDNPDQAEGLDPSSSNTSFEDAEEDSLSDSEIRVNSESDLMDLWDNSPEQLQLQDSDEEYQRVLLPRNLFGTEKEDVFGNETDRELEIYVDATQSVSPALTAEEEAPGAAQPVPPVPPLLTPEQEVALDEQNVRYASRRAALRPPVRVEALNLENRTGRSIRDLLESPARITRSILNSSTEDQPPLPKDENNLQNLTTNARELRPRNQKIDYKSIHLGRREK